MAGTFMNNGTSAEHLRVDARVAGSKMSFIGETETTVSEYYLGNQVLRRGKLLHRM